MKSLFNEADYSEIVTRLNSLNEDAAKKWGTMSVGQMAWHCQIPLKSGVDNKKHGKKGNFLIKLLFKKSMYSDKPWRKNLPTSPIAKAKAEKNFAEEKPKLLQLVHDFHALKSRQQWEPHVVFGELTPEQWGKMQYKHLNHHLEQFGV